MNCPFCKKEIYALTGLQEIQKFQKHLGKCKKYQTGGIKKEMGYDVGSKPTDMQTALEIRAESGQ